MTEDIAAAQRRVRAVKLELGEAVAAHNRASDRVTELRAEVRQAESDLKGRITAWLEEVE